jgi:hypothetical protein
MTILLTPDGFREAFPQFESKTKYPDAVIQMFINQALCTMELEEGPCYSFYFYLLTAHLLQLFAGLSKGKQGGFVVSSTIDSVTVSKLAPPAESLFDWWLAQTGYGQQLHAMLEIDSVGGFSVGGLPERKAFRKVGGTFQ